MQKERQQQEQRFPTHEQEIPYGSFIEALRTFPHFVVWKYTLVDGKAKKPPFDPRTGQLASPTNPHTWGEYGTSTYRFENRYVQWHWLCLCGR